MVECKSVLDLTWTSGYEVLLFYLNARISNVNDVIFYREFYQINR